MQEAFRSALNDHPFTKYLWFIPISSIPILFLLFLYIIPVRLLVIKKDTLFFWSSFDPDQFILYTLVIVFIKWIY